VDDAVTVGWAFLANAVILLPVFLLARMKGGSETASARTQTLRGGILGLRREVATGGQRL
jgi:hypothetical protein